MTTYDPGDQAERRRVLREQAATYHQFAQNELSQPRGRFTEAEGKQHVVGSTPGSGYPAPPSGPWSGTQPEPGPEPPTGYRIDALEPSAPAPAEGPGPTSADAPVEQTK
jgi:hypothetical protein